ncbi:exosome complex exonuclease Rrp41 [Candidatus Woesearchaeota archaeon]|nr:exosome complex exonuclease Rrp41 [Candidatus Woesearchaeota archaeon]
MTYTKRLDGRKHDELRETEAKVGVIKRATGSAKFRMGNTTALAAVYGPRELHPRFLQDPEKGRLRCNYNMMPFSGMGDRVRPGANRRAKEISMVTTKALLPAVDLKDYPNAVVDVFIELPQTDAGSRCVGIVAASMALADAGIPMKDLVCAVAVGKVDKSIVIDLDYEEEQYPKYATTKVDDEEVADIPIAMIPSTGEITLLQLDGDISKEDLIKALKFAKPAMEKIYEIQKKALKEKYSDLKGGKK